MYNRIIGTPGGDSRFFDGMQSYDDTCAIRCQETILQQYLGLDIEEDQLINQATELGLYSGEGTDPQDLGGLLEANGVPVDYYSDATPYDIAISLAEGKKVMVGVDSDELWGKSLFQQSKESIKDLLGIGGADHAVIVSGIDTSDPDNVKVILTDPGTGEHAAVYDIEEFVDAWKDSNFLMVATVDPAPHWLPEMENFDYNSGHIPNLGGVQYTDIKTCDKEQFSEQGFSMFSDNLDNIKLDEYEVDNNILELSSDLIYEDTSILDDIALDPLDSNETDLDINPGIDLDDM
jgi:hypothetical protein